MRFPGVKPPIGLPILLIVGIVLVVYGFMRSDNTGILFGVTCIVISIFFAVPLLKNRGEDTNS